MSGVSSSLCHHLFADAVDNEWFLASRLWPCEPSDLEKRTHLLMRLAENTSHRDKLEILSNLPGLEEELQGERACHVH